ncbi:hypothetical protein E5163_13560 [Marinicauda algicola]|uniref:Uncharacterized protein n=1 Tax=Marinicauda algicola TaxID=2029849 RepID=A0A4S2GY04_9PROT|nr:hypothetical protein [Marinicauda algicola]TGY87933.1 hypothetical protein E5163_13560 [Marinicauda algicola]
MAIDIQVRGVRLVATLAGAAGWQDIEEAFETCAAWLDRDAGIGQVLFDLRTARLGLSGVEADQLAELVTSTFPRPVTAAIVEPEALAGRERVVQFAAKLERLGLSVAICASLKGAVKYLRTVEQRPRPPALDGLLGQVKIEIERILMPHDIGLRRG